MSWCQLRDRSLRIEKKESEISYVNKEYFESHRRLKIRIEMVEMWIFYHDKDNQLWLWWAIDHDTGVVRHSVFQNGTNTQNCRRTRDQWMVLRMQISRAYSKLVWTCLTANVQSRNRKVASHAV